jgi:hypothetical protein
MLLSGKLVRWLLAFADFFLASRPAHAFVQQWLTRADCGSLWDLGR